MPRKSNKLNKTNESNKKFKKITLMIPCYNEEASIGQLIDDIPVEKINKAGYKIEVLVIDNNSKDKTAEIAKAKGARVISEFNQGKGNAIRTGFNNIPKDVDYVVMLDGDNTYKPAEILRLIEPLESDFADVILGSRLEGKMTTHAMSFSHRFANWVFTFLTRSLYQTSITDTCTGYFAWTRKSVDILKNHIKSKGFAIEAEMISKMTRLKLRVYSVPITYAPRPRDPNSKSKLNPFKDALKIIWMLIKNRRWKPKKEE
ncbi:MAG TPA: glycosyltransferase family 2 protein [Caldisericia bacterium]|nr:glycosyltransferase family 2 protein [Caldisericia bacterium]